MPTDLSPSQAAARIGATTRSVQRWIAAGRLPATRVGGRWRVASDALDAFVALPAATQAATKPGRTTIERLFVANRGEIANRIRRTCDVLGIDAIVPETEGANALDLLDIAAVVAAATAARADAVHPGFGFLAENADFAQAVLDAGLRWIGPPPGAIRAMGDKAAARRLAHALAIPTIEGYDGDGQSDAALTRAARTIGFPVLLKPAAGGGGKGMRIVGDGADLPAQLAAARREGRAAFGDERLVIERFLEGPRHVEVQVLFDAFGGGVHLGERDCSWQRRHQKVLEETPSPAVGVAVRRRLTDAALALAGEVGYVGAGTCEFLLDDAGNAFFLEMNTRLQVEHPVTELVTGRDLVADQIRIAAGEALGFGQRDVRARGHAIEVRLYAEDAEAGFLPATGPILEVRWPAGEGIRVDAGVAAGDVVGGRFDPMLAKVIAYGPTRRAALARLTRALDETVILGLTTNLRFLRWLVRRPETIRGEARIDTLEQIWQPGSGAATLPSIPDDAWAEAAGLLDGGGWRLNAPARARLLTDDGQERTTTLPASDAPRAHAAIRVGDAAHLDVEGRSVAFRIAPPPDVDRTAAAAAAHATGGGPATVVAPMPGAVLAIHVISGSRVEAGDPIVTLEAMKMEHVVPAPSAGTVLELGVRPADQVTRGQLLARLEP
ncbi:MAG TPA: biotin carboxylase N-terminal domain-containing protein [Candidatus Limnocylindrales bacterium]|nr:biotin carboxylase N-terminal domain-containing protein [Candidatus Limnocylindrales bacterium]